MEGKCPPAGGGSTVEAAELPVAEVEFSLRKRGEHRRKAVIIEDGSES